MRDHREDTLNICELSTTRRNLEVNLLNPEHGSIALDNLFAEIICIVDSNGVLDTTLLNLTSGLDLGIAEVAVWAVEGHEDDLAEERNPGQEKACDTLDTVRWCRHPLQ